MTETAQATNFEAVIGLEVHVELSTRTKMFCGCATDFGGEPNTRTCPVCLGQPGSLPVPNGKAVEYAIRLGLALGCEIAPSSVFHRKNYFYPDMPKNYQISQYDVPLCVGGHLDVTANGETRRIGITRVHMEEDTGKSLHIGESGRIHGADYSLVEYNRAGIPLLEVVSEPDIRSAEEARAYLAELRGIVRALDISDAKLEEGSMRCDANISLRPIPASSAGQAGPASSAGQAGPASGAGEAGGHATYGTRVEVKNMNSLRSLQRAITHEIERQTDMLLAGEQVVQETRHWDEAAGRTSTLRAKEEVFDYRYFPDPDLVPVEPDPAWISHIGAQLPELPAATRARLARDHRLGDAQVQTLVEAGLSTKLDDTVRAGAPAVEAANWLANEVIGWTTGHGAEPASAPLTGADLAELIGLVTDGTLSKKLAREVLEDVLAGAGSPSAVVAERGLQQISDTAELEAIIDVAIADNADAADQVRSGNHKAIGALVGAVMRETKGQANPQLVNDLLRARLLGE